MQQGRGGMGSRKHGTSGHSGKPPRFKQNAVREANRELTVQQKAQQKRKSVGLNSSSVAEAMRNYGPRIK